MTQDNTKQLLLNAAQKLFAEKGYEAVSTRELAEVAGVNLGAIQYHFGSKAKLFVEAIHEMMSGGACVKAAAAIEGVSKNKIEAARKLCNFVIALLDNMLRPKGPDPFRLIFREILSGASHDEEMFEVLVSSTVENYTRPLVEQMVSVLAVIRPELSKRELSRISASIAGQCSFYVTHQPFVERLNNESLVKESVFQDIAKHICKFSLQALLCETELINQVIKEIFDN